jgi:hypothetical protein
MTTTVEHSLPRPPQLDPEPPNWTRALVPAIVAAVALVSVLAWAMSARTSAAEIDASDSAVVADVVTAQRDATAGQAVDLATLVRVRCADGVIRDDAVCSAAAVVQAQPVPEVPPPGEPGMDGSAGPAGPAGAAGLSPACLFEPAQCRGPAGPSGADGAPGVDGEDGTDGATGPAGADGADGLDGTDGADGADGAVGPAGPAGPMGPAGPAGCDFGLVRDETGTCVAPAPAG